MATVYVFADETGNFDFSRRNGASRYFGVGTVVLRDEQPAALSAELGQLRRQLAWRKQGLDSYFHATEDTQEVRDEVFRVIDRHDFAFHATMFEKSKAQPQWRASDHDFYKYAWFYHFKYLAPREIHPGDSLFVATAAIGTKKDRGIFRQAVNDVLGQCVSYRVPRVLAFWPSASEPCLQVADYCTWAISRKYERNDLRSYQLIGSKLRSDFDMFGRGRTHYY